MLNLLFLFMVLGVNFGISWLNASYCGRYWSESKQIGGSFRRYIVVGYIMAIAGFTMVYANITVLLLPVILKIAELDNNTIRQVQQLSVDMMYVLSVFTIIPTGFYIWVRSLKNAWEQRTLSSGLNAAWNSYANVRNIVNVSRNTPSALGRIIETLFGGKNSKKRKKDDTIIVMLAILVVILAIFGGYFTASAILKKADREYDMFSNLS